MLLPPNKAYAKTAKAASIIIPNDRVGTECSVSPLKSRLALIYKSYPALTRDDEEPRGQVLLA